MAFPVIPFLKRLFVTESKDWAHWRLDAPPTPVVPDKNYFEVRIDSMRLTHSRVGFKKFHAAVHSFFTYTHTESGRVEMQSLTSPKKLQELDKAGLANVLIMNQTVLGPVPYRGGTLQLEMGLFAVEADDVGKSFLSFVSEVSDVAGVSYLKSALPILGLVKSGVDLLLGTNKATSLEVGVADEMKSPQAGTYILIADDKSKINQKEFSLDSDKRLLINKEPYTDANYFVYSVDVSTARSDWAKIPDLRDSYNAVMVALRDRRPEKDVNTLLDSLRVMCITTPDLLAADADMVFKRAEEVVNRVFGGDQRVAAAVKQNVLPEFKNLNIYGKELLIPALQ
jgi:hypothetical protein